MSEALAFGPPVITVDVEDWPQSTWNRELPVTERAVANTRRVLQVLRETGVRATMFVLGKFAESFPSTVKEIHSEGHEVACHGYGHIEIFKQSREDFREDVRRAKDILEQITGERVRGYRAPEFSIVRDTLWAFEVLGEAGFDYDSSVFPIRHPRYGIPDWPITPVQVRARGDASVVEVPIATCRYLGENWPAGGGGYHRLLPSLISQYLAKRGMSSAPFVFYCHPYELDAREFKEIPQRIPLSVRIHQGLGRGRFQGRFVAFLKRFGGRRVEDLIKTRTWPELEVDRFRNEAVPIFASEKEMISGR